MFGDPEGFRACLGYDGPSDFEAFAAAAARDFPTLQVLAATTRTVASASRNTWGAVLWTDGRLHRAPDRDVEILDRVGGGDAFASGVIYAFLQGLGPEAAVAYGAAHGALAMTTPGDASMSDLAEIEALVAGAGARVVR
jgi:2-dehydro-3-deoxygluconokinase